MNSRMWNTEMLNRQFYEHIRKLTEVEFAHIKAGCLTRSCIFRTVMQDQSVLLNCSYRYNEHDPVSPYALWIDGPFTCLAAILSLIGAHYAIKFLCKAGLNRSLTAALFALCAIDSLLLITVFFFYGIEAMSMLFLHTNIMYDNQPYTYNLHGIASSLTTASTMLVIYITFLRFMVVMQPLRFATNNSQGFRRTESKLARKTSITIEQDSQVTTLNQQNRANFSKVSIKRREFQLKQFIKPFCTPFLLIIMSFCLNIPIFFEFEVTKCFDVEHNVESSHPEPTTFRLSFTSYKAVLMTLTQTIGPVAIILVLSVLTEYRVHVSLRARRKLFESQNRNRSVVLSEELKERVSRTLAIFIAVKFLIFRTMPIFFDVYENIVAVENWGVTLSILVRVSDFGIVLNTATNSLAYFGKRRWVEKRLRLRLLKKEEKRNAKLLTPSPENPKSSTSSIKRSPTGSQKTIANNGIRANGLTHPLLADKTPLVAPENV
ncbi:unnamed protein product [Caenorhabditis angaria]|uniref:G-protein coupled receptors family 1 profile domain-containing protein n=1 Tax=Caenorhabditis angaria TaxID=860376 RepID=A0A9P1N199_9PELO|nr:unnamed protein product [Caenorhabditis angaria]